MTEANTRYQKHLFCARLCMAVNLLLACLKISSGFIGYSKAMLADGVHSLFDLTADIFVILAIRVANRPSDARHPYGYNRFETLGNIVISIVLMLLAIGIAVDAILGRPMVNPMNWQLILPIASIAIMVNELTYRYVMKYANLLSSDLLRSTAVHQRSDAGTSSVVLISAIGSVLGVPYTDRIAALIIAAMILYFALPSTLKSIAELLDRGLSAKQVQHIESLIGSVDGVLDYHLLRTRQMASKGILDVHIVVDPHISVSEGHFIGDQVEAILKTSASVQDVTVHIDFYDDHQTQSIDLPSRSDVQAYLKAHLSANMAFDPKQMLIHYHPRHLSLEFRLSVDDSKMLEVALKGFSYPKWLHEVDIYVQC